MAKVYTDTLLDAMERLKFSGDYPNYSHINYDEPLLISNSTFSQVHIVVLQHQSPQIAWPFTATQSKRKWLDLRKK